jgi:biotin carboxyl carrier protein
MAMLTFQVKVDDREYTVVLESLARNGEQFNVTVDGQPVGVVLPRPAAPVPDMEWMIIDDRSYEIVVDPGLSWVNTYDGLHTIEVQDANQRVARPRSGDGRVKAPIPGLVTRVLVEPGAAVVADQPLFILEAMKMENEIRAPFDGVVSSIAATPGQTVVRGQVLAEVS